MTKSSLWYRPFTIEECNQRAKNTLCEWLGIEFTEVTPTSLSARMPVDKRTVQPIGILHGGANVVLAETVASAAANAAVNLSEFYCVGLEINANHIRSVRSGFVTGIATTIHIGQTTQVWQVNIVDESGKITCTARMTAAVLRQQHK